MSVSGFSVGFFNPTTFMLAVLHIPISTGLVAIAVNSSWFGSCGSCVPAPLVRMHVTGYPPLLSLPLLCSEFFSILFICSSRTLSVFALLTFSGFWFSGCGIRFFVFSISGSDPVISSPSFCLLFIIITPLCLRVFFISNSIGIFIFVFISSMYFCASSLLILPARLSITVPVSSQ